MNLCRSSPSHKVATIQCGQITPGNGNSINRVLSRETHDFNQENTNTHSRDNRQGINHTSIITGLSSPGLAEPTAAEQRAVMYTGRPMTDVNTSGDKLSDGIVLLYINNRALPRRKSGKKAKQSKNIITTTPWRWRQREYNSETHVRTKQPLVEHRCGVNCCQSTTRYCSANVLGRELMGKQILCTRT